MTVIYAMNAPGKSVVHGILRIRKRGNLYNERKEEGILKYTYAPLYSGMQFCDCIRCR